MSKPAKGVKGCLLWNAYTKEYFFRVYSGPEDSRSTGGEEFKDYALSAEDISIEIQDESIVLRDGIDDKFGKVDWSDKVLGR